MTFFSQLGSAYGQRRTSPPQRGTVAHYPRGPRRSSRIRALGLVGVLTLSLVISAGTIAPSQADAKPARVAPPSFITPGPFPVVQTAKLGTCRGLYGQWQLQDARRQGMHDPLTCNQAFPFGDRAPVGVDVYYPADRSLTKHPVVVFVPGAGGNAGYFSYTAKLWASRGFIAIMAYDFVNALAENHLLGIGAAMSMNNDRSSALHNRVDLKHIVVSGHSAGGGGALQVASLANELKSVTRGRVVVVGALLIQSFVLTSSLAVLPEVPTLILTGEKDESVPPSAPIRTKVFNRITKVPAWFAVARGAQHLTSAGIVTHNPFSGAQMAFLTYVTRYPTADVSRACSVFAGPHWTLPKEPELFGVVRNGAAARRSC